MPSRYRTARFSVPIFLSVLALLAAPPGARAQTWSESPDAGDEIVSAQATVGVGPLNTITGTLSAASDVDIFCITITDPAAFFAGLLCAQDADPNLFLFDSTDFGVTQNETCQSGYTLITGASVPVAGTYYLAVTGQGAVALSGAAPIWVEPAPGPGERAPDGPDAGGTLVGWDTSGAFVTNPNYTVNLNGAAYCGLPPVPTVPTSWGLLKSRYSD